MNNCSCSGLLPLIFGYITGKNQNCCGCDQNMISNDNGCGCGNNTFGNNGCWLIILLLLICGCGSNNSCN